MNWQVPASVYPLWKDFTVTVTHDLELQTGHIYHLQGINGSGKTSFIKKVLIPVLKTTPDRQAIYYVEQQVQSQLDAIQAYASMQHPAVQLNGTSDILNYQLALFKRLTFNPGYPVFIILDESSFAEQLMNWLQTLGSDAWCVIFISHAACPFDQHPALRVWKTSVKTSALSELTAL